MKHVIKFKQTKESNQGKKFVGTVVSAKMKNTVIVEVVHIRHHPLYKKTVRKTVRFFAHTNDADIHVGDTVRIGEVKPISKKTHFIVLGKKEGTL